MRLGEICQKIGSGATPTGGKNSYADSGISLIRSQNVLDFAFSYNGLAHINEEQADKLRSVVRRFGEVVEKFYAWRECALKESASLTALRDFLLPLLMNGQVRIGGADE